MGREGHKGIDKSEQPPVECGTWRVEALHSHSPTHTNTPLIQPQAAQEHARPQQQQHGSNHEGSAVLKKTTKKSK